MKKPNGFRKVLALLLALAMILSVISSLADPKNKDEKNAAK